MDSTTLYLLACWALLLAVFLVYTDPYE